MKSVPEVGFDTSLRLMIFSQLPPLKCQLFHFTCARTNLGGETPVVKTSRSHLKNPIWDPVTHKNFHKQKTTFFKNVFLLMFLPIPTNSSDEPKDHQQSAREGYELPHLQSLLGLTRLHLPAFFLQLPPALRGCSMIFSLGWSSWPAAKLEAKGFLWFLVSRDLFRIWKLCK